MQVCVCVGVCVCECLQSVVWECSRELHCERIKTSKHTQQRQGHMSLFFFQSIHHHLPALHWLFLLLKLLIFNLWIQDRCHMPDIQIFKLQIQGYFFFSFNFSRALQLINETIAINPSEQPCVKLCKINATWSAVTDWFHSAESGWFAGRQPNWVIRLLITD